PGQYGAPPPASQHGFPPQQQYGASPPGQYSQPSLPSPGYSPQIPAVNMRGQPINVSADIEGLYKAMKGWGTDEKKLISVLGGKDPLEMAAIRAQYQQRYHQDLVEHLKKECGGDFGDAIVHLARGPLLGDVYALKASMKGMGTKENALNEILISRNNADIHAIKTEYQRVHRTSLEADLKSDLSAGTEDLFLMLVAGTRAEDSAPVIDQQTQQDVDRLVSAMGSNSFTKNAPQACQVLVSKNDAQIRAMAQAYQRKWNKPLLTEIKSNFSGHMEKALVLLIERAHNRPKSDAQLLEEAMAGPGTKDTYLIQRLIRAHWDKNHMQAVVNAYRQEFPNKDRGDLVRRVQGETSGDYERLLVACI
ncbi:Annexin, partial [Lophiostoma macrostomum CBS 122681]